MPSDPNTSREAGLSKEEIRRYSRHLLVPEFGMAGQQRLRQGRVVCVGAGGLGSPVTMYLTAAGVGTLGIVDYDNVDVSNLQRQVLYTTSDAGHAKLAAARQRLTAMNPLVRIETHAVELSSANALEILAGYDVVVDASDNFQTRYLVNDACVLLGKPNVSGSVFRFEGQVSVYGDPDGPCYRCLYPEPPPPGLVPGCGEAGVLGMLPGIIGTIQAAEVVKLLAGVGEPLVGRLLVVDALKMRFREVRFRKDPECPICSAKRTIHRLVDYEAFCGLAAPPLPPELEIAPLELKARLDRGDQVVLIDVREKPEADINRLPGALLIPMEELSRRVGELGRDRDIVLYCKAGVRSAIAVRQLRAAGFERVAHLRGGILQWIREVEPELPLY